MTSRRRPVRTFVCPLTILCSLALTACPERGASEQPSGEPEKPATERAGAAPTGVNASRTRADEPSLRAQEPAGPADDEATLTVTLQAEPAHLNPLLGADALASQIALGDIYEGLLCQEHIGQPARPCLARSVTVDATGRIWSFELRPNVSWHDGATFSASDVEFTYRLFAGAGDRPAEPVLKSWLAADFDDLLRIATRLDPTSGKTTVVMTFADFRLGRREAFARVPILPRHRFAELDAAALARADENRAPIGTGPLRLSTWTPGQELVLQRYPGYWGEPARAAQIKYRVIASRQRVVRALIAGTADIATRMPADEAVATARKHPQLRVFTQTSPSYLAAVYNLRRAGLGDVRARRALGLLMDRETLAEVLFAGHARPISGPYLRADPDRDASIAPLPYSPARARQLLAEMAAERSDVSPLKLTVMVPSESRTMRRLADIWAADARAESAATPGSPTGVSVALDIDVTPYAQVLSRLRTGDFDIALMAFTTGLDLDLYSRFHSAEPENYGALSDEALDRALDAVRRQPEEQARRMLQHAVQTRIHALQPYTFIASGSQVGLVRVGVGGFANASTGARQLWRRL